VEGSQSLDPFGNSIDLSGTIGTPYGFTGELVDGSGLLDLRARRYSAVLGVFTSHDPVEGQLCTPMSLNEYSWVQGNVPNFVDPSGTTPERGEARYSCKCGWLDGRLPSAGGGHLVGMGAGWGGLIRGLINEQSLEAAQRVSIDPLTPGIVINIGAVKAGGPLQVNTNAWYYIPRSLLSAQKERVALGAWMEFNKAFESGQLQINDISQFFFGLASGFSEEDLPSDLLGYYSNVQEGMTFGSNPWTSPTVQRICDPLNAADSDRLWDFYNRKEAVFGMIPVPMDTEPDFIENWRQWERRPSVITPYLGELDET